MIRVIEVKIKLLISKLQKFTKERFASCKRNKEISKNSIVSNIIQKYYILQNKVLYFYEWYNNQAIICYILYIIVNLLLLKEEKYYH